MDAAAIVENAGNSGRERRLGKGCEHVQTWSSVFHNRLENALPGFEENSVVSKV